MKRKSPKFIKRPPRINAPLKIEKFNKRPRRLIEVIRYTDLTKVRNLKIVAIKMRYNIRNYDKNEGI